MLHRQPPNHGSSPRPWGTPCAQAKQSLHSRFIPTSVGNTVWQWCQPAPRAVHPHVRGEHHRHADPAAIPDGSSPRPWGTPTRPFRHPSGSRFIPTSVGNTSMRRKVPGPGYGSSPRPWGTRGPSAMRQPWRRFIPTSVGNTQTRQGRVTTSAVHPHVRGEH